MAVSKCFHINTSKYSIVVHTSLLLDGFQHKLQMIFGVVMGLVETRVQTLCLQMVLPSLLSSMTYCCLSCSRRACSAALRTCTHTESRHHGEHVLQIQGKLQLKFWYKYGQCKQFIIWCVLYGKPDNVQPTFTPAWCYKCVIALTVYVCKGHKLTRIRPLIFLSQRNRLEI